MDEAKQPPAPVAEANDEILMVKRISWDGDSYVVKCPHCKTVIGVEGRRPSDVRGEQYQLPAVQPKERAIIFSAPMIRAIRAGEKTQTRRIAKAVKHPDWGNLYEPSCIAREAQHAIERACPYGQPGDRLWVKESTFNVEDAGWIGPVYVESDEGRQALEWGYGEADDPDHIQPYAMKKRSPIFMKRSMSRITLEITGVRVERLRDISEADAKAEGAPDYEEGVDAPPPDGEHEWSYRASFQRVWERINGPDSWDASPWVWIIEFERVTAAMGVAG